jgi:hypothetical protein
VSWRWKYRAMRSLERRSSWLLRNAARIEESAQGPGWRTDFDAAARLDREADDARELAAEYRKELGL